MVFPYLCLKLLVQQEVLDSLPSQSLPSQAPTLQQYPMQQINNSKNNHNNNNKAPAATATIPTTAAIESTATTSSTSKTVSTITTTAIFNDFFNAAPSATTFYFGNSPLPQTYLPKIDEMNMSPEVKQENSVAPFASQITNFLINKQVDGLIMITKMTTFWVGLMLI